MSSQAKLIDSIELTFTGIAKIRDIYYMTFKKDDKTAILTAVEIPSVNGQSIVVFRNDQFLLEHATNENYHLTIGVVKMKMVNVLDD